MSTATYRSEPFDESLRHVISRSSDEHLSWMIGPDRQFYDEEALEAAEQELEIRLAHAKEKPSDSHPFNIAAFFFGPLWYFYHCLFGRGLLLFVLLYGALLGLIPVIASAGLPVGLAAFAISVLVHGYCGRYGNRDLAESRAQELFRPLVKASSTEASNREISESPFVHIGFTETRMSGEQAKALLEADRIPAIVKCEDIGIFGPGSGVVSRSIFPARIYVPKDNADEARLLLTDLLSERL